MQDFVESNKEEKEKKIKELLSKEKGKTGQGETANQEQFKVYFQNLWGNHKLRVKKSSKREVAKYFFILGIQSLQNELDNKKQ